MKSNDNLKLLQQTGNCTYESPFVTVRAFIFMPRGTFVPILTSGQQLQGKECMSKPHGAQGVYSVTGKHLVPRVRRFSDERKKDFPNVV